MIRNRTDSEWLLGLNPTSFRHAEEFCRQHAGHLISLNDPNKIQEVLKAIAVGLVRYWGHRHNPVFSKVQESRLVEC